MMNEADDFWRGRGCEQEAQKAGLRLDSYEASLVRRIVNRVGKEGDIRQVKALGEATLGRPMLTLGLFHETFPDFPLRIVAAKLDREMLTIPLRDLFERPTTTPVHEAYLEACDRFPDEQAVVLVFPWTGFGTWMTLHTLPREFAEPGAPSRTKLVYAVGRANLPPQIYTVESLDGLLDSLAPVPDAHTRVCPVRPSRERRVRRRGGSRPGGPAD
jgi:hypothetical protein